MVNYGAPAFRFHPVACWDANGEGYLDYLVSLDAHPTSARSPPIAHLHSDGRYR